MNVPPKATGSARKSMWYPKRVPQWLLSEKSMPEEGWSFCNIGCKTEKSCPKSPHFFHGPMGQAGS